MKKIIWLVVFAVFYILSIYTSNFPYPEYAEHPLVSFIFSLLTIISFLLVTAVYAKSRTTGEGSFSWIITKQMV